MQLTFPLALKAVVFTLTRSVQALSSTQIEFNKPEVVFAGHPELIEKAQAGYKNAYYCDFAWDAWLVNQFDLISTDLAAKLQNMFDGVDSQHDELFFDLCELVADAEYAFQARDYCKHFHETEFGEK